jgi:polyisoprenoid-binding protein YceI
MRARGAYAFPMGTPLRSVLIAVVLLGAFAAQAKTLHLVPGESQVRIHVGKSGMFAEFAHEHDVSAPAVVGDVTYSASDLSDGAVSATFDARRMIVVPEHEPKDAPKVQATMLGPEVLDTAKYPRIRFTSKSCLAKESGPHTFTVQVTGELELHGVVRPITVPLRVELSNGNLDAVGTVVLRQTEFGIKPIRLAGGAVTVPDEITVQLKLIARESR